MSATKHPRPRRRRGSSFRAMRAPIIRVVSGHDLLAKAGLSVVSTSASSPSVGSRSL